MVKEAYLPSMAVNERQPGIANYQRKKKSLICIHTVVLSGQSTKPLVISG